MKKYWAKRTSLDQLSNKADYENNLKLSKRLLLDLGPVMMNSFQNTNKTRDKISV